MRTVPYNNPNNKTNIPKNISSICSNIYTLKLQLESVLCNSILFQWHLAINFIKLCGLMSSNKHMLRLKNDPLMVQMRIYYYSLEFYVNILTGIRIADRKCFCNKTKQSNRQIAIESVFNWEAAYAIDLIHSFLF